jgi:hypothetical protein
MIKKSVEIVVVCSKYQCYISLYAPNKEDITSIISKNIELFSLCFMQSISSDISGFTGDEATRKNIKLLIKSLSRLL